MSLLPFLAIFVSFTLSLSAFASPSECSSIESDTNRLACFDRYFPDQDVAENTDKAANSYNAIASRQAAENQTRDNWFSITPHKQNYILPATYNSSPDYESDYGQIVGGFFSDAEIKFQLSLKTLLIDDLWGGSSVSVAYTQQSFWQLYADSEISAPFRETNHEPEVMWNIPMNFEVLGFEAQLVSLAFNHQSNGRSQPLSRSWNRVTGELVMARNRFVISAKTWKRIAEGDQDDNPNIEDFMGRLQLGAAYKGDRHTLALGVKSSLGSKLRNGVELNWTFPLTGKLRGFVQVYSGYGENLIDMDNYNNRIGVGIALTDWL